MGIDNKNMKEQEQTWESLVKDLKEIASKKGITQQEIANLTGIKQGNVSRFFSLKNTPTLKTFIIISNSLNSDIIINS